MKKSINILIIGSKGQLGSEISRRLILNKKIRLYLSHKKKIKLLSIENSLERISNLNLKIIINCSAYTNVDAAENNKYLAKKLNYEKVLKLANFCKKNKIILIHFSTDYVFGGNKRIYKEKDKPNPINFYGKTKYLGEQNIINSGCKYFVFRISWLLSKNKESFVYKIQKKMRSKREIYVINDNYGNPTSVSFISKFINKNLKNFFIKKRGIYNLVNRGNASWYDIASKLKYFSKNKKTTIKKIASSKFKSIAKRPKYSCLSMVKTKKNFIVNQRYWQYELQKIIK